jgi:hypothetical protein
MPQRSGKGLVFHYTVNVFSTDFEVNAMNDLSKDILIGSLFVVGIWSFISGQFVISALLFGSAAIFTNIVMRAKLNNRV